MRYSPASADPEDRAELERLLAMREEGLNRQLGVLLLIGALGYTFCWICSMTQVFLTGRLLGTFALVPGALAMAGALLLAWWRSKVEPACPACNKYVMLGSLGFAAMDVALLQLVWAVPVLVGLSCFIFAYNNTKLNRVFATLLPVCILLATAANAAWGMPNPDMVPYPVDVTGIEDGYVTLWAMAHPGSWSRFDYFCRILRYHTIPLCFLMMILVVLGNAMVKRHNERLLQVLGLERQIRSIENALMTMAFGGVPAVPEKAPTLTPEFVASVPAAEIPKLMRSLRERSRDDAAFASLLLKNPESALRALR